jgi:hypothetical protein
VRKVGKYYIMQRLHLENMCEDIFLQLSHPRLISSININTFVKSKKMLISYEKKLEYITSKYSNLDIIQFDSLICEFDINFHIKLIESVIEYVNNLLLKKNNKINEFKVKLLWYYSLIGSIIFASNLKGNLFNIYKDFIIKDKKTSSPHSAIIKQELRKTKCSWCSSFASKEYDKYIDYIHNNKSSKVLDILLPVGHLIKSEPRFYHPSDGWIYAPEYLSSSRTYIENNIIIGYNYKPEDSLVSIFKIRDPIKSISGDLRKVEKGAVCTSKTRKYLTILASKLNIDTSKKKNLKLCDEIKSKLLLLELYERVSGTNIKWFYQHYEKQPYNL